MPIQNPQQQIIAVTHEQNVLLSAQQQDVQGKSSEHGARLPRQVQLLSHVDFEDKSKKKQEHRYQDRICKHGLVSTNNLTTSLINQPNLQPKANLAHAVLQGSKGLSSSHGSLELPLTILSNQGDPSLELVLCKDEARKCKTCGNMLTASESRQNEKGQKNSGQSSNQITQPNLLEVTMLTESSSLDETSEATGVSDVGDRVSSFGKLRRRSRKGENRVETSHGPYARGQDLLAQRRNSRTRSSMEDVAGPCSKPARGVTFAIDYFTPIATSSRNYRDSGGIQLPIKSALKSGSKSRPIEQQGVKILPSAQEVEKSPHHAVASLQDLGAPSPVSQVSSGLTPCIKPSSLRYSSPVVSSVEQVDGKNNH